MTDDFLHLFRGNTLVAGLDDTGHGRPGPLRLDLLDVKRQWHGLVEGHLTGHLGIGVYPYNPLVDGVVWGCVDFDEGEYDSWAHAQNLHHALHVVGIRGWIERSRSKGYHVWVFSGSWVPARWMRRLLLGACATVGAPSKEVNPKSSHLEPGQLGNFVRLPYKGYSADRQIERQVMVDLMGKPLSLALFMHDALEGAATADQVVQAARTLYVPPERRERPMRGAQGPWIERLEPLARVQLEEGPKEGGDRSGFLFAFGLACAESGLDENEIEAAVRTADEIHTHKYEHRKDATARYEEIARKAIDAMAD